MSISIFGSGYVGLVSAACFADMGNHVICVDINKEHVEKLTQGKCPIYEPGLETLLQENTKAGRLTFTTNARQAVQNSTILFIAVGTPPQADGSADMKHVEEVADTIGAEINEYKVIVNKSN